MKKINFTKGQNFVEYCVLFAVVVAVVIAAGWGVIKPAVNSVYKKAADSLSQLNTQVP